MLKINIIYHKWDLFILKEPHSLSLRKKTKQKSMRFHSYWGSAGLMAVTVKADKVLPISDSLHNDSSCIPYGISDFLGRE